MPGGAAAAIWQLFPLGDCRESFRALLEHVRIVWTHLTGIILSSGEARFEERCSASVEERNAARRQKNPAFGGPWKLIGGVALLARCARIAPRSAPTRVSFQDPSNVST